MKKILLIIALTLCIFQLVVLATAIDMGSAAINRASWAAYNWTYINKANPANASGTITAVETYAEASMTGVSFATFYCVGNVFTTRDYVDVGNVAAGYVETSGLSLAVETGDYIGIYYATGNALDWDTTGGSGRWRKSGDYIPCTGIDFGVPNDVYAYSLYGTGETPAGITWNGIVITKWNGVTITIPLNTQ